MRHGKKLGLKWDGSPKKLIGEKDEIIKNLKGEGTKTKVIIGRPGKICVRIFEWRVDAGERKRDTKMFPTREANGTKPRGGKRNALHEIGEV